MLLGTHYSGSEVNVWADPEILSDVGKHHGIFLVNHHYEVDWLFTWVVADAHNQVWSLTQLYSVDFFTVRDWCKKVRFQQTPNFASVGFNGVKVGRVKVFEDFRPYDF